MKIETPVLKRLGPIPFWRGEEKCLDALERAYRKAMESARQRLARGASVPQPTTADGSVFSAE
ncbi:MAG: hypothetical protein ACI4R9_06010 [Kiritimatiellia bacterium]